MSDHSELKKAAEAAIVAGIKSGERWPQDDDWFEPDLISAELDYVKKASPTAIRALITEVEALRSRIGREEKIFNSAAEELVRDAARYRWLRSVGGKAWRDVAPDVPVVGVVYDIAVDASMPKKVKP